MSIIGKTREAYRRMAAEARYRPAAPSDGFGNITVAEKDLDLEREATKYTAGFIAEEDTNTYHLGCPNYSQRTAFIFALEGARACCSADPELALRLLRMAVADLEAQS